MCPKRLPGECRYLLVRHLLGGVTGPPQTQSRVFAYLALGQSCLSQILDVLCCLCSFSYQITLIGKIEWLCGKNVYFLKRAMAMKLGFQPQFVWKIL